VLEEFLEENNRFFEPDYVPVKIDTLRMTHGAEVARKLRDGDGGIPWMAILDPDGKQLITADGPRGNIGYPFEPHEIEHFIVMLKKTAKKLKSEEIGEVEKVLKNRARKLKEK